MLRINAHTSAVIGGPYAKAPSRDMAAWTSASKYPHNSAHIDEDLDL